MEIELLRSYCLSLPAVTEDIKWGNDLVFSIGTRMFCVTSLDQPLKFSFKVKDEEFEELCATGNFSPAPYLARAKWVLVSNTGIMHNDEWKARIKQSYELVKSKLTKKEKTSLGIN
jgi:predicted DNA-binding protein (MmcQ/YjbR family)